MPEKSNGDYYYVEDGNINDLMDAFQVYQDTNDDLIFYDVSNDEEVKYEAGVGFDVPASRGYQIDGSQVLSGQLTLDDNSGGTADDALEAVGDTSAGDESGAINNNFTEIYEVLTAHGLTAPSA